MSTTSPNFSLVIATTADTVNVVTQIAGNFSTLDSLLGIVHTGTGQLKSGVTIQSPTLVSPTISGTLNASVIVASTGSFATVTATGGSVTGLNTFGIGNYAFAATIGSSGHVLTVVTGNAQWAAPAPGTGANGALSNLASVAINTNLNTFTAGFVTVARVIATSGALTGLTSFQATTGTFAGNLAVTGTVNANALNCTGGAITAAGFAIGTYGYPTTAGSTGQILTMTTGNSVWLAPNLAQTTAYFSAWIAASTSFNFNATNSFAMPFATERFDSASIFNTSSYACTVTASGYYQFGVMLTLTASNTAAGQTIVISLNTQDIGGGVYTPVTDGAFAICGQALVVATSGDSFSVTIRKGGGTNNVFVTSSQGNSLFWGYKVPDV